MASSSTLHSKTRMSPSELRLGILSLDPTSEKQALQPFLNYLVTRLNPLGVKKGRIVATHSLQAMDHLISKGKIDLFLGGALITFVLEQNNSIESFLRQWKNGTPESYSLLLAAKDSPIQGLQDLSGKTIAFEKPTSTTGHLLPKFLLQEAKLNLKKVSPNSKLDLGKNVGFLFSYENESTLRWIDEDRVQCGAIDGVAFKNMAGKDNYKIIHQSANLPQTILSYRSGLSPILVDEITQILLNMEQDPAGRKALKAAYQTTKFDLPPKDYNFIIQSQVPLAAFIREELNLSLKKNAE